MEYEINTTNKYVTTMSHLTRNLRKANQYI